jgi:transcriptional regulator with XRE-family HTH domain
MPTSKTVFEPIHGKVGAKIKAIREMRGWTVRDLGKRVDLSFATISNIENGKQQLTLCDVELYAKALGTSPLDLMRDFWK